jgi:putative sigma-54 modulation protein
MRLELTGRHVDITPALRRLVDSKLTRLERVLNDTAISAQIVLTREKGGRRADVTLHARGEKFLHGSGLDVNWGPAVAKAIDKIVQQARKLKGKWLERKRHGGKGVPAADATPAPPGRKASRPSKAAPRAPHLVTASRQPLKPMALLDAVRQVEGGRQDIVIFQDLETSAVSVLVRRANGELTLVQAEN